ncbi:MAG: hypothetical protein KH146_13925, partial [Eggerthella sp.]|uniref:hypothetical protein n=1 Tax=Eggerthella sp. TaxID=1929886 RepID=UPI001ECB32EE
MPTRAAATHALRKNLNPYVQQNRVFGSDRSHSPAPKARGRALASRQRKKPQVAFCPCRLRIKQDCQKLDFAAHSAEELCDSEGDKQRAASSEQRAASSEQRA